MDVNITFSIIANRIIARTAHDTQTKAHFAWARACGTKKNIRREGIVTSQWFSHATDGTHVYILYYVRWWRFSPCYFTRPERLSSSSSSSERVMQSSVANFNCANHAKNHCSRVCTSGCCSTMEGGWEGEAGHEERNVMHARIIILLADLHCHRPWAWHKCVNIHWHAR